MAIATATIVVSGLVAQSLVSVLRDPDHAPGWKVSGVVGVVACGTAYLVLHRWAASGHARGRARWVAIGLVVLSGALLGTHGTWALLGLTLAGVAQAWPSWNGATASAFICLAAWWLVAVAFDQGLTGGAFTVGTGLLMGAVLYTLGRLATVLHELQLARAAIARAEVTRERTRISRDLHDVIGRTLVAVSLRSQAATELVRDQPDGAIDQLRAVQDAIAAGQGKLRELTSGPLIVSLADEVDSSRSLLERVGVRCTTEVEDPDDPLLDPLAATVVRESVTNLLKHSRPQTCSIAVHHESASLVVTVVNDGCPPVGTDLGGAASADGEARAAGSVRGGGTGLASLRALIAASGGFIDWGPTGGGRFRVHARLAKVAQPHNESRQRRHV